MQFNYYYFLQWKLSYHSFKELENGTLQEKEEGWRWQQPSQAFPVFFPLPLVVAQSLQIAEPIYQAYWQPSCLFLE